MTEDTTLDLSTRYEPFRPFRRYSLFLELQLHMVKLPLDAMLVKCRIVSGQY